MGCDEIREQLLGHQRGHLAPAAHAAVAAHLETCLRCRQTAGLEGDLSALLEHKLPRFAAPVGLKRRLAGRLASPPPAPRRRFVPPLASAAAAAALTLVAVRLLQPSFLRTVSPATTDLVGEAVNDHLRVVASSHPIEI